MSTPLTDSINALTTYANEVTGASDTTLSDAVHTLASGYGGGGASSWTKVAETSYQASTTSTSAATVDTWETGHSELWTSDKWVYVRIRDTAGKRDGHFYGTDQFFMNSFPVNDSISPNMTTGVRFIIRCATGSFAISVYSGQTGYGVYADKIYEDGRIEIKKRYNASNSLTVDSTYKVEVYLLDPAGGVPIFE